MPITAVIVDDEKLARSRLKRLLARYESIEIVGEARNGREALRLIEEHRPDVLFLDIKMPFLSGFEMLGKLETSPYIIFTTAYDRYALQAFEENTIDYLLKPISDEKLDRAIDKLTRIFQQGSPVHVDLEKLLKSIRSRENIMKRFSVKLGERIFIIPDHEIVYFHSEDKYTFLNTTEKNYIVPFTLKELEARLDPECFIRVHRGSIVNIVHIGSIHKWFGGRLLIKMKNGKEFTVSQNYVNDFKAKIHL
jgi:two-component system LytT family response regulator